MALHNRGMICPHCKSSKISKNGHRRGKQNYICRDCERQFVEYYSSVGYSDEIKERCLKMYVNGTGFRAIERQTGVNHNTIINWVRKAVKSLPDAPESSEIPEITQVDELETFIGKKNKKWLWTAANKDYPGILAWVLGDRSAETFQKLWQVIKCWHSFFYVTDGYPVYPCFIDDCDHIVKKTYMTRIEGENTRLRHYLARLHRKTLCYSKSENMLKASIKLLLHYLHYRVVALPA
jgi:insertion element IS1 protein InsB